MHTEAHAPPRCVGTSLQSGLSRRCDAQGRDSSPHAGDCKRTSASPSKLPIPDADRGPKGKGKLVRDCGLREQSRACMPVCLYACMPVFWYVCVRVCVCVKLC